MTCPVCKKPYEKRKSLQHSVYVYRRRCDCKRKAVSHKERVYNIRDLWRDEVMR